MKKEKKKKKTKRKSKSYIFAKFSIVRQKNKTHCYAGSVMLFVRLTRGLTKDGSACESKNNNNNNNERSATRRAAGDSVGAGPRVRN